MTKRLWFVVLPGRNKFAMISLDSELDYEQALESARTIWPSAGVE